MKKISMILFIIILMIPVCANSAGDRQHKIKDEVTIDLPDDWYISTLDNIDSRLCSTWQVDEFYIKNFLSSNLIDAVVVTPGNENEFLIQVYENDYSRLIYDISTLSDSEKEQVIGDFIGEDKDFVYESQINYDDNLDSLYIHYINGSHSYQFITIKNGKIIFIIHNSLTAFPDYDEWDIVLDGVSYGLKTNHEDYKKSNMNTTRLITSTKLLVSEWIRKRIFLISIMIIIGIISLVGFLKGRVHTIRNKDKT